MTLGKQSVAVIGGSSGIGLAIAQHAARAGATVTIAGRSYERLLAVQSRIEGRPVLRQLDTSDEPRVEAFFDALGAVDHVVVTAGGGHMGRVADIDLAGARGAMESKFWGQVHVARYAGRHLSHSGSLTLVSGQYGSRPTAGAGIMGSVNAAIDMLGQVLALELAPIRVNVISPGLIDTPLYGAMDQEQRSELFAAVAGRLPVGRVGIPDDVAALAIALMTNGFVTGTVSRIDGGAIA